MSKNFEVLLRADRGTDLFATQGFVETMPKEAIDTEIVETAAPQIRTHLHIDNAVHKEETRLIERVFLVHGQQSPAVVVFSGVESTKGTSGICARAGQNLAGQTSSRVCLIDGDPDGALHDYFGAARRTGMMESISDGSPIQSLAQKLGGSDLFLIFAGRGSTAGPTWNAERWFLRLQELRREFRYVLILAPPVAHSSDALLLGQGTDGLILVLESQITHRERARSIKESLAAANMKLLGAVLNNRTFPIPESIYRKL